MKYTFFYLTNFNSHFKFDDKLKSLIFIIIILYGTQNNSSPTFTVSHFPLR